MGAALAEEAIKRGIETTIVCGPTQEKTPENAKTIRIETAKEMRETVLRGLSEKKYGIFISAAAVSDYTPEKTNGKISSGEKLTIKLKPTEKIVDLVKEKHQDLFVVGFKAEYNIGDEKLVERAKKKMFDAKLDLIVANDVSKNVYASDENQVHVINKKGVVTKTKRLSKRKIAETIWDIIIRSLASQT